MKERDLRQHEPGSLWIFDPRVIWPSSAQPEYFDDATDKKLGRIEPGGWIVFVRRIGGQLFRVVYRGQLVLIFDHDFAAFEQVV